MLAVSCAEAVQMQRENVLEQYSSAWAAGSLPRLILHVLAQARMYIICIVSFEGIVVAFVAYVGRVCTLNLDFEASKLVSLCVSCSEQQCFCL